MTNAISASPDVLTVCCAVEGDYVGHNAAMLHSVLQRTKDRQVQIIYFHPPELPSGVQEPLRAMVEREGGCIRFVEVPDDKCDGLPTKDFTRKVTWYRILVPDLLPNLDRVLFLDSDLVVMDSLSELWSTDLTDAYVAAVTNVFQLDHVHRPAELGLDMPQRYFNAGVLLMNLDLMRREGCSETMLKYGRAHSSDLMFRDQDVLNVVLSARRRDLHPRWNCMNSITRFAWASYAFGSNATQRARHDPAIRHFEGPGTNKPWHVLCDFPMRELYFEHRRHTPWPRVRLEGVTARNLLTRSMRRTRARSHRVRIAVRQKLRRALRGSLSPRRQ